MKITIVIPALNEAERIGAAVERAWAAGAGEVIVVDGGSTDATVELASRQRCRIVHSRPGRAVQQNAGASEASGQVLLFQHADTWLAAGAARQVQQALADPSVLGGAFRQRIEADGWCYRCLERANAWRVTLFGLPYGDQGIFLRRSTFFELGGFPEVNLMEDLLLMKSLRRRARPLLLPGPLHVSARRWRRHGLLGQTLRNLSLRTAHRLGASPNWLAHFYPRHDARPGRRPRRP